MSCSNGRGLKTLLVLLLTCVVRSQTDVPGPEYYCLEDYKPIGSVLRRPVLTTKDKQGTSGHLARQCSVACSADSSCTAFKAVGHEAARGPSCLLLTNTTAALPAALSVPPGADWPHELVDLSANGSMQLRSVGWLCLKGADLWDTLGQATHAAIHAGSAEPPYPDFGHKHYCAFGTDTAGTNLQQYTSNIHHPVDCDALCANSTAGSCLFWTFVASQPSSGQAPYNCFLRTDPFAGENGYTGKPKPDIWIPDSEMECFTQLADWRQLGLILSPAVKTIPYGGVYYTLFPERVTWQEANSACASMPGSELAILDTRGAIDTVYRELLSTLSPETGVTSAWVGATGNNTHYNATAQNQTGLSSQAGGMTLQELSQLTPQPIQNRTAPGPETTLVWSDGSKVDGSQLRRLIRRSAYWSAHDVIWNQQYVPDSSKNVCVRVLIQTPPSQPLPGVDISAAVLPGLWYFDCTRLAAYICQSSKLPAVVMVGRSALTDATNVTAPNPEALAPNWRIAVAVIVPTFAVLLILWQMSCLYSPQVSRLPEIIRQQHKRTLGQPRYGRMSIVVTDIQGFTNLMRDAPDDMAQALLTHNQIMKQACYEHVGYILEQEGDSFTLAFHEPQDAVAFTLQVQQALLEQPWSPSVSYNDTWENTASVINTQTANQAAQQQQQQAGRISVERGLSTLTDSPSSRRLSQRSSIDYASPFFGWMPGLGVSGPSVIGQNGRGDATNTSEFPWSHDPAPITALSMAETDYGLPPRSAFSRRKATWLQQVLSPGQQRSNQAALFRGLRVRMGVSTGVVRKGEEVKSSALYKTAQDVSNAAVGGEVLLDEPTFLQIKEDLWRLGLISGAGLDYDLLHAGRGSNKESDHVRSAGKRMLDRMKLRRAGSYNQVRANAQHALALDMGCYELTSSAANSPTHKATAGTHSNTSCLLWTRETGDTLVRHYQEFLQHQLQKQHDHGHNSEVTGDPFLSVDSDQIDLEHGYRSGSLTGKSRAGSIARQHLQSWLSMEQQQLGVMQLQEQHWWQQQQLQRADQEQGHSNQPVERRRLRPLLGIGLKRRSRNADKQEGNLSTISPRGLSMSEASTWSMTQVTQGHPSIRLYQVVAPRLVGRAALFGSQLSLPAGWAMLDAPYFAAPGLTATADSSSSIATSPTYQSSQQLRSPQQQMPQHRLTDSLPAAGSLVQQVGEHGSAVEQGLVQQGCVQKLLQDSSVGEDVDGPDVGHQIMGKTDQDGAKAAAAAAAAAAGDASLPNGNGAHQQRPLDRPVSPFAAAAAAAAASAAAESSNNSVEQSAGSSSNNISQQQQQHLASSAGGQMSPPVGSPLSAVVSSPVTATSSALLRGMSLRAEWALPSLTRVGSATGAAAAAAQAAVGAQQGSVLRPQYPAVTVVFAMVEDAQQLLRQPLLARPTHLLIQRLMLKTLTSFPGSYLVRAQEGDLKYMAAFTSPAAAAEWCLTVQEASLYLPYPLEVLGLSSCGVQLDATGRLVFRGPRFKMGLSEGTPRCILPDHMGRADYHGPFVNQAARYADAAAHGGQIVSDGQLAKQVTAHWHSSSSNSPGSRRGGSFELPSVGSFGRCWQLKQQQQQQQRRLMRAQSAEGSLAADLQHFADTSQQLDAAAASAAAEPESRLTVPPGNQMSGPAAPQAAPAAAVTPVEVECNWLGSFLYKGNPQPIDMVGFAPVVLRGRSYPAAAPGGKGTRLVQRVGVLDKVTVQLPAVLEGFRLQ